MKLTHHNAASLNRLKVFGVIFLLTSVLMIFTAVTVINANQTQAGFACGSFPVNVANQAELDEAIGCFNGETTAGNYEINLTADIPITSSLLAINNSSTGISLDLIGNGYKIDGQNISGTRPIAVFTGTVVTLENLEVTGGHVAEIIGAERNLMSGGGIINYGDLTLDNTTIISNVAEYWGGGIFSEDGSKLTIKNGSRIADNRTVRQDGGGIQNFGTLIIDSSVIEGNEAKRDSGGIGISTAGVAITISNSSILNNSAIEGGGIYNRNGVVLLSNSVISGNVASQNGGGIFNNRGSAVMTVTTSTIVGNLANKAGGGIHNNDGARMVVMNSSILSNRADGSADSGGAIFNETESSLAMQNSTVSGNVADYAVTNEGMMGLAHVTIASNSDVAATGGVGFKNLTATVPSQVVMHNTVIADHVLDCSNDQAGALDSTVNNLNNLIETDAACSNGTTLSSDPQLLPLADNGGATLTHLFAETSPLLNGADSTSCAALVGGSVDQRGLMRPAGACDIGAIELIAGISVDNVMVTGVNSGTVNAIFTLTRNETSEAMSVVVNTADGTAKAGEDYTAVVSQTVSFAAGGAVSKTVSVPVLGDIELEGDETFKLLLSNPVNVAIIDNEGIATIKENKTVKLTLSGAGSIVEQDSGTSDYVFTFTLDSPVPSGVNVTYTTMDGTAMVGDADYEFRTGTVNLVGDAGAIGAATVIVKVSGDNKSEADETFSLVVTGIDVAEVGVAPVAFEAVIKNDDEPLVNLSSDVYTATEAAGSVVVRVELTSEYSETITVDVKTVDGTALAGSDYTAVDETLTFTPGQTAQDVTILIADNENGEDEEAFLVQLSNITNGIAGSQTSAAVTIAADENSLIYLPMILR